MNLKKKVVRANDLRKNKNDKKARMFKKIMGVLIFELLVIWLSIHIVAWVTRDDKHKIAKPRECWEVSSPIIEKSTKDMVNGQNTI